MPRGLAALPAALGRLEEAVERGEDVERLRRLGAPPFVALLFDAQVRRLVRIGPRATGAGPAGLLRAAQRAAALGVAPASTPVAVRRALDEAAREVRRAGAWRRDRALWWQPLPRATVHETLWRALDSRLDRALAGRDSAALGEDGWRLIPRLLPAALRDRIFNRLERRYAAGRLELTPGRVGSSKAARAERTDEVRLLSGYESDLLRHLRELAVVVQWCRERLAPRLAAAVAGRALFAPRAVLLARYPEHSAGFSPHLDNPGGEADNGRGLSGVLYLNPGSRACAGGELALWHPGATTDRPADQVISGDSGAFALFEARTVRHAVRPLGAGPPRWSMAIWFNEAPQEEPALPPLPPLSVTDVLLPVESPPLARGRLLRHELDEGPAGQIVVRQESGRCRAGIVCTVAGEGERLMPWCRHHLEAGFEHLVLVFDDLEDAAEAALAEELRSRFPEPRLTVWSSVVLRAERWAPLARASGLEELLVTAEAGAAPQAVASRQALNATAALHAAKTDELGGATLDWLVHLDGDELFFFHGPGRGGAEAGRHFHSLTRDGVAVARYLNHELLLPVRPGGSPRFKRNPRLAAALLGPRGWERLVADLAMGPADPRAYFHGYRNGKSAVAVGPGLAAAGVHGWSIDGDRERRLLAGPSVLHFHFASVERLERKLLAMAADTEVGMDRLFEPCRSEREGLELVRSLLAAKAGQRRIRQRLRDFRDDVAGFGVEEEAILAEAGLLLEPGLLVPRAGIEPPTP